MAFELPFGMKMGYRVTQNRVICIVYQYLGDHSYKYGASIYKETGEKWSTKEIKKKIRLTAKGRAEKNPVYVDFTDEQLDSEFSMIDLIREKLHKFGVAGKDKKQSDVISPKTPKSVKNYPKQFSEQ